MVPDSNRKTPVGMKCLGWGVLVAYMGLVVYLAFHPGQREQSASVPLWKFQDSDYLRYWMKGFVLGGIYRFVLSIPLGFLVTVAFTKNQRGFPQLWNRLSVLLFAIGSIVLVEAIDRRWSSWPGMDAASLMLPLLGCLLGIWIGHTWLRGWRARLWLLPKIVALFMVVLVCAGALFLLLMEEEPMSFTAVPVTSADKRRLVDLIRSKSPRSLRKGQTETLRLTEHDIGVLLSWGLSLGSPQRKATVDLTHDSARMLASVGVPMGRGRTRYLNLLVQGRVFAVPKVLTLHIDRCRLGSLEVPQCLLTILSPMVTSLLEHWRVSRPFLEATQDIALQPGSIEFTYGPLHVQPHKLREGIFGTGALSQEVLMSTRAQADNLLAVVSGLPQTGVQFGQCLETVFALARERSTTGDPVMENRAAIFALGMLLGHRRLEEFLGPVLVDHKQDAARRVLGGVRLRGRSDWVKHFCLSAAIYSLSDEAVSDAAGLLKEELDAGQGGSGFSFTDLLADQAGTTFAAWATRDVTTARALQDRLARGFRVDDFVPQVADLPEGLSDAEFQSDYGGVGGEGYRRVMAEIQRRIDACPGYRTMTLSNP